MSNTTSQRAIADLLAGRRPDVSSVTVPISTGESKAIAILFPIGRFAHVLGLTAEQAYWGVLLVEPRRGFQANLELLQTLFELSPAEVAVVSLLLGGDSTSQIAQKLGLSSHTLRSHLKNVFRKTGTSTQSQLVAMLGATQAASSLHFT